MNRILMTVAASALVCASGVALAQQDANNPAPSYSATSPVKNQQVKHIQDGNNGAPRYAPVAAVANKNVQHIQDGNNAAPRYSATTKTTTSTTKATGTVHARQHARAASHG
jgi:glucose dehydrogenase